MLDTNIVSDLMRNPRGRAAQRLRRHGEEGLCLSIITAAELRYGVAKRASALLLGRAEAVLSAIDGAIRAELEAAGQPIGPTDLFIAAHARALGVTLVTHNVAEFRRVRGLTVENWLE